MAKSNDTAQIEFVKGLLRNGVKRKEILARFAKKWQNSSPRTVDRRLKQAEQELQSEIEQIKENTTRKVAKEVEERGLVLLDSAQRQDILSRIALGEIKVNKTAVTMEGIIEYEAAPDHTDRINAIKELNKIDGNYATDKNKTPAIKIVVSRS